MGGLWFKNVYTSDTCSSLGVSAGDQIQIDTPKQTFVNALSGTIIAHTCNTTQQSDRAVNICNVSNWNASTNMSIQLNAITTAGTTNTIASIAPSTVGGSCDDTWDTCAGSDETDCLTCPTNSHRPNNSAGGSQWDCDDGWYRSGGDPGKCDDQWSGANATDCAQCSGYLWISQVGQCLEQNCDSSWETCISTTANDCITCPIGEYLEQVGAGPAGTCNSCGDRCATCQAGGVSQCDTWIANAQKTSGFVQDSCDCNERYYWDGSIWDQCSIACKVWSGPVANECIECVDHAIKNADDECVCIDGYVENLIDGSCSSCKPDWTYPVWKKCVFNAINQCTECYENAIINSDHWVCASEFAGQAIGLMSTLDHDATSCEPCAGAWFTWAVNDKNSCQSCVDNAQLNNDSCTCYPGFSLEVNRCVIIICHRTWFSWIGAEVNQWNSCHSNAFLNNGSCICNENFIMDTTGICKPGCYENAQLVNSICVCRDGYFPNPKAASCISWDPSCQTCTNIHSWNTCPVNSFLLENGLWESCEDQAYYDSQQESCLPWLPFCANCTDENSCDTCVDAVNQYIPGECCGDKHFRDVSQLCQKCAVLCQQCSSLQDCASCVDFTVMISGICECQQGYHEFEDNCEEDGDAPDVSINVASANMVQLSFDKQILQQLSTSNTEVSLEGIDPDLYTYQIIEVEPGVKYEIVFDFADSVELNKTKVDIEFRVQITDLKGNGNEESQYEAILPDMDSKDSQNSSSDNSSEQLSSDESAVSEGVLTTVATTIRAGILSGYVTGDLTSTWGFINTIQILAFIPLMDSQMPELIKTTLVGLLEFELIPNLFEFVLDEDEFIQQEPYDLAKAYGFENNVFLINWGGILVNAFMILWIIPIMLLLGKWKNSKIADFAKKSVYSYKWCFFLRVWIELHLEVGLAAYFQFMTPYWNNVTMVVNSLLGYFALVITFLSFPMVLLFMIRNRRLIQERDELFYKIYGSLFEEFQNSMGAVSTLFYSWFFLRRTIYIITLILLRDYVGYQLMINLIHTMLTLLFLIIYRPYTDQNANYVQIYSEIVTGMIFSLCACFHFDGARENSETIKWTVIGLIMSVVLINLILTFIAQFKLLKALCLKGCRKRTAKVDSVKETPIKDTRSITSIDLEETEMSQPYQKPEAIARPPVAISMSCRKRRLLAHNFKPGSINFETPNPQSSPPIIDQEPVSPEVKEADLTAEQEKALDYRMHKDAIKQQVERRVRKSYGAKPGYINFAKVKPDKSVPILTNESIGSMDMDEIMSPQGYEKPSAWEEQSKEDVAEAVARRIKASYATRPKYINFEPIFHGRNNNG